eukprot:CAMPEP_0170062524 /NCGR_PEP_ID=MMETSP0019_2-20121128/3719_1 /TAXON_ID=98059 /ORGANISM="Dinobryon sp., Strain UTEXLB2267" /LENGTH=115 /DNA_ID=CAMNT_0010268695 /DNA_START=33 /DNA_END=376 /DNA_ORIENTATION=-
MTNTFKYSTSAANEILETLEEIIKKYSVYKLSNTFMSSEFSHPIEQDFRLLAIALVNAYFKSPRGTSSSTNTENSYEWRCLVAQGINSILLECPMNTIHRVELEGLLIKMASELT